MYFFIVLETKLKNNEKINVPNIKISIMVTKALKLWSFKASIGYIVIIFIIVLIIFIIMLLIILTIFLNNIFFIWQ